MLHTNRPSRLLRQLLLLAVVALGCRPALAAGRVKDDALGITLDVPDGFVEQEAGTELFAFASAGSRDETPEVVVGVRKLSGTIGPDRLTLPATAPPGARLSTVKWRAHDLDVMVIPITQEGVELVGRSVQIPIRGNAVQISVLTPKASEAAGEAALQAFVAGFDGPSSWGQPLSAAEQRKYAIGGIGGIVVVIGVVAGLWWWSRRRRLGRLRREPAYRETSNKMTNRAIVHGLVMGLAVYFILWCIWLLVLGFGSPVVSNARQRQESLVEGGVKMSLFTAAVVFGVSSWWQHRRAKKAGPKEG